MEMPTGTIKKLVADRGFGFIAAEDGKEFFFHRSGTEGDFDSLRGGEKVTFEIEASPKGPRARSVRTVYQDETAKGPGSKDPGFFFYRLPKSWNRHSMCMSRGDSACGVP